MRNKKLLSLTAGIILILIVLPGISLADDAETLKEQINSISGLTAEIDELEPNIVKVSGRSEYGADTTISLNIDNGVTVKWGAFYDSSANPVINYEGLGIFEVGPGGQISKTGDGNTIDASGQMVIVTGTDGIYSTGRVTAGNGSAIHATGPNTTVIVRGFGEVGDGVESSALYPVIFINNSANTGYNVFVLSRGRVVATDSSSAIQSYGCVSVVNGEIHNTATYGHAIDIIGNGSVEVNGGTVMAPFGNGIAINIDATDPQTVDRASVIINNGYVATLEGGHAIRTTGNNSTIDINGGLVLARAGNAILAEGDNSTINITGGFVFAYGTDVSGPENVIHTVGGDRWTITNPGIVVAWDKPDDKDPPYPYVEGYNTDLITSGGTATWYNSTYSYIHYTNGRNSGFFSINNVTVGSDYGLIFDADSGKMYFDFSGDGMIESDPEYVTGKGTTWTGTTNSLKLNNFSWNTSKPTALRIINGEELTLNLSGNNSFTSSYNGAEQTDGVISSIPMEIEGDGTLSAEGGTSENSVGINCAEITINGGTVTAYGGTTACIGTIHPPVSYTFRTSDTDTPPAIGTLWYPGSSEEEYEDDSNNKYLQIISEQISVISDIVVSGDMKTALSGTDTATVKLYGDAIDTPLTDENVSDWFIGLPDGITVTANAAVGENTITFTFSGTPSSASAAVFEINIPDSVLTGNKDLTVQLNNNAKFDIGGVSFTGGGTGVGKAAIIPETELSAVSENGINNTNQENESDSDGLNPLNDIENKPVREGNQSYILLVLFLLLLSIALFVYRRIYEEKEE